MNGSPRSPAQRASTSAARDAQAERRDLGAGDVHPRGARPARAAHTRITSYNVCYTKLLRPAPMPWRSRLHEFLRRTLDNLRLRVSLSEALPQLAIFGILCGLLAGAVMIAFRLLIETAQSSFLPGGNPENYEGLALGFRVLIPP